MSRANQSGRLEVRRALQELRRRTAASLQEFNAAVPHASWLRRSEIERFTVDLLRVAERAPQRRRFTALGAIKYVQSWIARVGSAARLS